MTSRRWKIGGTILAAGLSLALAGTAQARERHHEEHEEHGGHGWSWGPHYRHYHVERGPRYYAPGYYSYYRPRYYYPAPYAYGYYEPDPYNYGYYPPYYDDDSRGLDFSLNW